MERIIKFRVINSLTDKIIAYEEIDKLGNFFWYYPDMNKETHFGTGSFDVAYLGDGFLGKLKREQFTGLLDKNGKEIYEGDALKIDHEPRTFEVVFNHGCFQYKSETKQFLAPEIPDDEIGIIGTIHNKG